MTDARCFVPFRGPVTIAGAFRQLGSRRGLGYNGLPVVKIIPRGRLAIIRLSMDEMQWNSREISA